MQAHGNGINTRASLSQGHGAQSMQEHRESVWEDTILPPTSCASRTMPHTRLGWDKQPWQYMLSLLRWLPRVAWRNSQGAHFGWSPFGIRSQFGVSSLPHIYL